MKKFCWNEKLRDSVTSPADTIGCVAGMLYKSMCDLHTNIVPAIHLRHAKYGTVEQWGMLKGTVSDEYQLLYEHSNAQMTRYMGINFKYK